MEKDTRDMLRTMGSLGALGFTMVILTFAGLALGLWLDKITGLKPLFSIRLPPTGYSGRVLQNIHRSEEVK